MKFLHLEIIVKRMKLWRNGQYLLSVCSFGSCHAYKLCTVKVYIYSYWVKSTLSPQLYVLISEENAHWPVAAAVLVYMGFVLFCFCVVNWYLKNKKQQKIITTTVYRLKITAFYTTEILSQDFQSRHWVQVTFLMWTESPVVSPHNGECTQS